MDSAQAAQHSHSQSDIKDILKKKRKIREHKACYPCRQRKVKCDSQIPCKTCVERNHPELCSFNPPQKRTDTGATHTTSGALDGNDGEVRLRREDWERFCFKLSSMERSLNEMKADLSNAGGRPASAFDGQSPTALSQRNGDKKESEDDEEGAPDRYDRKAAGPRYVKAMEVNEQSHLTGENVYLGGGSVPALVMALGKKANKPPVQEVFGSTMLPLFGLDNESATYPFVSLWGHPGPEARMNEICKALPSDAECLDSFRQYRDAPHVLFPVIVEIEKFDNNLLAFLKNRRQHREDSSTTKSTENIYGMPLQWVALLFSALASSAQFSQSPKNERDLLSQVYVCCSFECLRMVNYLGNPSMEIVQALLALGSVLSNAMNAGAAWSLVGLTMRFAQSLGLNSACDLPHPTERDIIKIKTWWMVMWQDGLLSVSYDRASSAAAIDCPYPPPEDDPNYPGRNFSECMFGICRIGLETVRNRVAHQTIEQRLSRCVELLNEHQEIQSHAIDRLKDVKKSRNQKDEAEYWALYLHVSYMNAELCRPAINPSTADFDQTNYLRKLCIENLNKTVEAFIGLANVSTTFTRSWAGVHRALSAALLLGILGEPIKEERCHALLCQLVDLMKQLDESTETSELPPPIARSIAALEKLCKGDSTRLRQAAEAASEVLTDQKTSEGVSPASGYTGPASAGSNVDPHDPVFYLPSPLSGFEDESSPYALMDSIIWGGNQHGHNIQPHSQVNGTVPEQQQPQPPQQSQPQPSSRDAAR